MVTVDGVPEMGIAPSLELCGGTHVARTGDIGSFLVVSESAIAAGVRRVEALCGAEAMSHLQAQQKTLERGAAALQVAPAAVPDQIEKLKAEVAALKKSQSDAARGGLEAEMAKLVGAAVSAPGGTWTVAQVQ